MNNIILFEHPVAGYITFDDLINDIKISIHDLTTFENIILNLLKELPYLSDEDISFLFNYSPLEKLKWILYLLETFNEKK